MKIIETLRNSAKYNFCPTCFEKYKALIAPSIEYLLFKPMEEWREIESDVTLVVMVTKGVLERDNLYLSLGDEPILFQWNQKPLRRNVRLIKYLKQNYNIDWVKIAKIKYIKSEKTIKLSAGEKSLSLRLNEEETKVTLTIDGVRTDEFIVERGKKDLNIYKKDKDGSNNVMEDFFNIKKVDWREFENIKLCSFTQKIDYLHKKGILGDFSHRVLDEANQVRNKIHDQSFVAPFSEQDLILFHDAKVIIYNIYRATIDLFGKEESSINLKNRAEECAKQCLLKLNYQ
jgi:hypothetical protein